MCDKATFDSEGGARKALQQIRRNSRHNPGRKECRCYWCSECRAWHLTSQTRQRDPKVTERRYVRQRGCVVVVMLGEVE